MTDPTAQTALAMRPEQVEFDAQQVVALKESLRIKGASDADMRVFFHQCRKTGLDPFAKQIYLVMRMEWDADLKAKVPRQTIQTGIDGFRVIGRREAQKHRERLEVKNKLWYDEEGEAYKIWPKSKDGPPYAAGCTIVRGDTEFEAIVYYAELVPLKDEYVDNKKTGNKVPSGQWGPAPNNQLMKCAEAAAYRAAFPQDLSGVYSFDEMERDNAGQIIEGDIVETTTVIRPDRPPRNWLEEIEAAESGEAINELWTECMARGEMSAAIRAAARDKAFALKKAAEEPENAETEADPNVQAEGDVPRETLPDGKIEDAPTEVAQPPADVPAGPCILTGDEGEDPEDHSTHDHAVIDDGVWTQ